MPVSAQTQARIQSGTLGPHTATAGGGKTTPQSEVPAGASNALVGGGTPGTVQQSAPTSSGFPTWAIILISVVGVGALGTGIYFAVRKPARRSNPRRRRNPSRMGSAKKKQAQNLHLVRVQKTFG